MSTRAIAIGAMASVILASGFAGTVAAQSPKQDLKVTKAEAVEIALAKVPGEVKETELEREDGKSIYEIEILTDYGAEMEVEINAETGDILKVEADKDDDDSDKNDEEDDDDNEKDAS